MAIIEPNHPAASGTFSYREYLQNKLRDEQVLLYEIDSAILRLSRNEKESYSLDSGQSTITVRRVNLPELIRQSAAMKKRIQETQFELDSIDNSGGGFVQVVPY